MASNFGALLAQRGVLLFLLGLLTGLGQGVYGRVAQRNSNRFTRGGS